MRAFFFIREIFRKFPFLLTTNIILLCMVSVFEAVAILSIIPVVDFFLNPNLQGASSITMKAAAIMDSMSLQITIGNFVFVFLLFNILAAGFLILARHFILRTRYLLLRDLMLGTFEDFFKAEWHFFSSRKQGMLINTFLKEMEVVGGAFGAMALFFAHFLLVILYLTVPFYISWRVTSISLAIALLFACPLILFGRLNYRLGKLNTSTGNEMGSVIQESLGSAKLILGFGNQRKNLDALTKVFDIHYRATLKSQTLSIAIPRIYYPLGLSVLIITLFVARRFAVPLSETAALLYSFAKVIPSIGQFIAEKNILDNFFPSYEQVLRLKSSVKQFKQRTGTRLFTGFNNEIVVKNLSFAYPDHEPTLADINVRIPKGKMIAFVSKSGAGKSTFIDMIMGFHSPLAGEILFDGVSLKEFDINSYRHRVGYVPQESVLFNMSIRENLYWAKEDATDREIDEACRQANADEFIKEFPKGYDTLVGDRGIRLSGGQVQRVALARAILRKPDILILDEATSSLDTHSERLIQQAIENIAKETTIIIVAHRLSTIVNADFIYVFKKGRIIEQGTYSELIRMNGEFHWMTKLQVLETVK